MGIRKLICGIGGLLLAGTLAPQACADIAGVEYYVEGSATLSGSLAFEIWAPGGGCSGTLLWQYAQAYDAVPGGALPTSGQEIGEKVLAGLSDAALEYGYNKRSSGGGYTKWYPDEFNLCVDGMQIAGPSGLGQHSENGVTVIGTWVGTAPTLSVWGMGVLIFLMIASSTLLLHRIKSQAV